MFWKIRKKLTFYYSLLLVLFLVSFSVISFTLFVAVNYYDKKETLHQIIEQAEHSKDQKDRLFIISDDDDDDLPNTFAFKKKYSDTFEDYFSPQEKFSFLHDDDIQIVAIDDDEHSEYFMMMQHDGFVAGSNITTQLNMLKMMLIIFATLTILFTIIAAWLGLIMSKKAMVPIATSMKRQREFVADASHELRTPLAIMHSSLEVINAEEKNVSPFTKQVMADMLDEVNRMTDLVSDLLTLARADSDALQLKKETFFLPPIIDSIARSCQLLANKKDISFHMSRPDDVFVYADTKRIQQLLYILLDNAIKYTPEHGEVKLDVKTNDKNIEIKVEDTGIGISKEDLSRIFDRFYRVDKARSRKLNGSGLGLSIAEWIIKAHDGTITVQSTEQKGTTFLITLPIVTKGDIKQ